jgi:hypothetical protein
MNIIRNNCMYVFEPYLQWERMTFEFELRVEAIAEVEVLVW